MVYSHAQLLTQPMPESNKKNVRTPPVVSPVDAYAYKNYINTQATGPPPMMGRPPPLMAAPSPPQNLRPLPTEVGRPRTPPPIGGSERGGESTAGANV